MSSDWSLIYSTGANGQPLAGDLNDFKSAVLAGADVKLIYWTGHGWWSRNCNAVNVSDRARIPVIAATMMEVADTQQTGNGTEFKQNPFAYEFHIYNSTGMRHVMKFDYKDHSLISQDKKTIPIRWYVKDYKIIPPWLSQVTDIFDTDFGLPPGP